MGEQLDNPNQQVVRPDGSGPAEEGTGGGAEKPAAKPKSKAKAKDTEPATETEGAG